MKYLNKEVISISNKLGFELIGFCKLEYFKDLEKDLLTQEKLGYKSSFQKGSIEEKTFKNASIYKSAIVVGLTYNKINLNKSEAYLSSVAVGNDYHQVIKEKLEFIWSFLKDNGYNSLIGVDNNIYDERYLAYKAGLGFYGKNHLLINKKYGSFFYIGIILTDALFKYNNLLNQTCLSCNKCIKACPTKAISKKGFNANKCLSYLTQKRTLTKEESKHINNCVYGCDICMSVCPHNKNIPPSNNFKSTGIEYIKIKEFLNMDSNKYKKLYKNNSSYWRGKKIIDRNVRLYCENKLKNK